MQGPLIRASIDLGTNTCLLLIAQWDQHTKKVIKTVLDLSTIVRLGEGVDQNRSLGSEAIERTISCLKSYVRLCIEHQIEPSQVLCVATSQARDAQNGQVFFKKVQSETGFKFRVLSGEQEASYSFKGSLDEQADPNECVTLDIGGGSTEICSAQGGMSIDMGSVRMTERFLKNQKSGIDSIVTDQEFWALRDQIDQMIVQNQSDLLRYCKNKKWIGVAGTITSLAQWYQNLSQFEAKIIDLTVLTKGDLHRMVEELKMRSPKERALLPGIQLGRADVILAGSMILWRMMVILEVDQIKVSTRGLRYGVLELI